MNTNINSKVAEATWKTTRKTTENETCIATTDVTNRAVWMITRGATRFTTDWAIYMFLYE